MSDYPLVEAVRANFGFTDPDSRVFLTTDGFIPVYNAQAFELSLCPVMVEKS
jgi:hypothetical protein